jgi:YgiT-type zinc finger domain-containing protein
MKCPICKEGSTKNGESTVTIERNGAIIFFKEVPALICSNCGETYFTSEISKKLFKIAQDAFNKGTELEIIRLKKVA